MKSVKAFRNTRRRQWCIEKLWALGSDLNKGVDYIWKDFHLLYNKNIIGFQQKRQKGMLKQHRNENGKHSTVITFLFQVCFNVMPPRTLVSALANSDAANKDNHHVEKVRWFESQGLYCEVKRCMFGPALVPIQMAFIWIHLKQIPFCPS